MKIEVTIRVTDGYNVVAESGIVRMTSDGTRILGDYADAVNDAQVSMDTQLRPILKAQQEKARIDRENDEAYR